ncbi:MAG: response regulator receiver sensor signal transduction histidine kinase [Myxococcales bacterium]|nr:response regulator receiver sensor signal transduction histidine kinase [Myxococcales bacterium]
MQGAPLADEILVVDDDADNRLGYVELLRLAGYRVREAQDGVTCLQAVEQRPPSLILLDVTMPGIDGFETLKRLRAGKHRDVPVILVTGHRVDAESIGSGLELGAEEYLQKPVRPAELRARIRALLKLSQARRELEALKRDQTAMLVHDLKQPLAIIALRAEFIEDEETDGEMKQSAHVIRQACRQMEMLINGVLEMSRVEAGQLTLTRAPVLIDDVVGETVAEMRDLATRRDITLELHAEPLGRASDVDRLKIVQVVQNLVGNALKFTPANGRIDVTVRHVANEVVVAVEDTGPGFGDANVTELFDRWHQTKSGRAKGGSGLGLAIARAIVEAHGGRIGAGPRVDSERGARFWFTLPLPPVAAAAS